MPKRLAALALILIITTLTACRKEPSVNSGDEYSSLPVLSSAAELSSATEVSEEESVAASSVAESHYDQTSIPLPSSAPQESTVSVSESDLSSCASVDLSLVSDPSSDIESSAVESIPDNTENIALFYEYYEKAFFKTSAMESYNINIAEQYNCPSFGLDETTLFIDMFDDETGCFSYTFYNRFNGIVSKLLAYGDEEGRVYINDNGTVFTTEQKDLHINMPRFFELEQASVESAVMSIDDGSYNLTFVLEDDKICEEVIGRWGKTAAFGIEESDISVESITFSVNISNSGYLMSETMLLKLVAHDKNGLVDSGTFTAEQCIEYALPDEVEPPSRFDFVDKLKDNETSV